MPKPFSSLVVLCCALAGACTEPPDTTPPGTTPPPAPTSGRNLVVTAADIAGCEAVLRANGVAGAPDTAVELPEVLFSEDVTGEAVPRAPQMAIAFVRSGNTNLQNAEIARFSFVNGSQPPTLVNVRCHTTAGATIEGGLQLIN